MNSLLVTCNSKIFRNVKLTTNDDQSSEAVALAETKNRKLVSLTVETENCRFKTFKGWCTQ